MRHVLEGSKLFPYIAWAVVLGFAFFTYSLASQLQDDLGTLSHKVDTLEKKTRE